MIHNLKAPLLRPGIERDEWVLEEDWAFYSKRLGEEVTIKKGFKSDLDSVPRIPIVYSQLKGYARLAAIAHDFLYASGYTIQYTTGTPHKETKVSRKTADAIFLDLMVCEKIGPIRRRVIWFGVRVGGWVSYKPSVNKIINRYYRLPKG